MRGEWDAYRLFAGRAERQAASLALRAVSVGQFLPTSSPFTATIDDLAIARAADQMMEGLRLRLPHRLGVDDGGRAGTGVDCARRHRRTVGHALGRALAADARTQALGTASHHDRHLRGYGPGDARHTGRNGR